MNRHSAADEVMQRHFRATQRRSRAPVLTQWVHRYNAAGIGSDLTNWACLASLIETCKLNGVNPRVYFTDLLTRLVNGWPRKRIDELMPWHWVAKPAP
jgi:hypothetical protein